MTQLDQPGPETWLRDRLAAGKPAETWADVPDWYYEQIGLPVPVSPHQVSDQGRIRNAAGHVLSQRPNGRPRELPPEEQYRLANLCTGGEKVTVPVHHVVLAGFHSARTVRAGKPATSAKVTRIRAWNWFPEGLDYCDARTNAYDKAPEVRSAAAAKARAAQTAAGTAKPPRPTFECRNHARCGGMALNEGSRCGDCAVRVGKDAAVLLGLHMPSQAVGEFFGCTGPGWVYGQAVKYGAYAGGAAEARMQRPTLRERIRIAWVKRGMR